MRIPLWAIAKGQVQLLQQSVGLAQLLAVVGEAQVEVGVPAVDGLPVAQDLPGGLGLAAAHVILDDVQHGPLLKPLEVVPASHRFDVGGALGVLLFLGVIVADGGEGDGGALLAQLDGEVAHQGIDHVPL